MANSKWLITGSVAAHHWFPSVFDEVHDIDILSPNKIKIGEGLFIDTQWHDVCEEIIERNVDPVFVDANMLLTIKFSHAEWDIHWHKTMYHIWKFQEAGCAVNHDIVPKLKKVWKGIHKVKPVNLKQPVSEFFSNDAVKRRYPHELVHEAVKFNIRPMHESIRPDMDSVWCSRELFQKLSFVKQTECAMEEIMVTAIERGDLNSKSTKLEKIQAIARAFKSLVTSMTTGWFNDFLITYARIFMGQQSRVIMLTQIDKAIEILERQ